jgi:hypothetical protein
VRRWRGLAVVVTLTMLAAPGASSAGASSSRWAVCGEWRSVEPRFQRFTPEAVAVVSPYDAWLVGGPVYSWGPPIALRWDGMRWVRTQVPLPKRAESGSLNAIAVVSPTDVWAVGWSHGRTGTVPFTVHWDGSAWHRVSVGLPGLRGSLEGLAVIPGTHRLWAVGNRWRSIERTLILSWDGQAWRRIRSLDPSDHGNLLHDVAVVGRAVWAVGERQGPDTEATLIERWNGHAWKLVRAPNPGRTETTVIRAVAGLSPHEVWAVGYYSAPGARGEHGLILRWDGRRWSVARKLDGSSALYDVVVVSPNDAWAVGRYGVRDEVPLVVRRHGSRWARSPGPRPGLDHGTFFVGIDGTQNNLWAALRIELFEGSYTSTYHRC